MNVDLSKVRAKNKFLKSKPTTLEHSKNRIGKSNLIPIGVLITITSQDHKSKLSVPAVNLNLQAPFPCFSEHKFQTTPG